MYLRHPATRTAFFCLLTSLLAFTPASAQERYALVFDGDGDYVTFDSTPDFGEAYTVELWFQTTATSAAQYLFAITDASSNSHYMMLRVESDGRIRFLHRAPAASSGGTSIYYDATDVRDGEWHHVAAVKDAAGLTLYFDGAVAATAADASSIGDYATSGVVGVLGQQKHNSDIQPFTGEIDDVRIWSEARSETQVSENRAIPLAGTEANLVGYWPFDEGSGTTSTDASGNGHDATLNGTLAWTLSDVIADPVLASDEVPGTALAFDGSDDYVELPGKSLIDPAAGTLELWFRAEGVSQTQMLIHGGENSANGFGGEEELHVNITSGGVIDFGAYGGDDPWRLTGTTSLTADTYHHVAAQWSEADGTVNLYLDGQLEATGSYAAFSTATWEDFLRLGVNNASSRLFAGQMDEVRLWHVARTEQQIRETMHRTLDEYEDGLVAYYQFNDAAGTTLTDVAGGNDGTLTNMDDADWEASTLTTGRGVSVAADVSFAGEVAFTDANLTLNVTEVGEVLVATRYDATPAIVPTWAAFAQVYDDRFWLLDPIGATPTADLTFDLGESVSSYDPFQFKLFHRENDLAADWTFLVAASEISGTAVTFAEQAAAGQFLLARTAGLDTDVGTMLSFDGVNDYISADAVTASFGDALTLEAWVRPDDTQDERGAVFGINTASGGNVLLLFYNEGTFEHYDTDYHPTDTLFPGNTWYHVAMTVADGTMQLFVDGALVLEHAHTTTFSATDQFSLGQEWDNTNSSNEFGGDMDEVRIWNTARTQAEIQATMHTPLTGTEDGLVAYYPLNDDAPGGFAATAADVVGGHDGALMNMVSASNNISPWETSTIAFGPTDIQAEVPGTVVFTDTGVEITYLSQTGATVTVTRLDESPATLPSAGTAFADQYWVINRAGSGLFNATLTFTPSEAFTASDEAVPDQIHLYRREGDTDEWEKVATASSVDATAGTATFREIRSFSQFLLVRGDVLDAGTVMATEDLYEDRVEITWADMPPDAARLKIFRGDTFLSYAASDDAGYSDAAGDPGVTYEYCVSVVDTFDATLSTACDTGRRLINPPQSLTATDGTLDDAVVLSWTDRSEVEAAYAVYRTEDGLSTALAFDGVDDYVTIAHGGDLDPNSNTGDVTVSAWMYLNTIPEGNATSVAQIAGLWFSNARTGPSNDGSYRLGIAADATLTFQYATSSTSSTLPKADNTLSANTWYFVAATFEANAELVFYVNEDKTVSASTPAALLSSDYDFRLGGPVPGDNGVWESQNPYFDGYISDVRLWNRALSEAEVQDTRTGTLIDDGLIGYWPLDESSGTVATDRTGSHDGTIEGPTWWTQDPLATLAANTSFYTDDTAEEGVPYTYCVVALDAAGFASEQACDEGYRGSVLPPLAVSASDGQYPDSVVVAWTPQADNATGFLIERDGVEVATTAADATGYADTGATDGTTHTYCVYTLIDDLASVAVCDEGGIGILAAPAALAASDDTYDDRIRLTWDDPGDTEDGFLVYRAVGTDTTALDTTDVDVTTYDDTSAEAGVAYTYCVAALSRVSGADVASEAACDDGSQSYALAPTDLTATDGDHEDHVELTWTNAATTAALLEVYRLLGTDTTRVKTTAAANTTYSDTFIPSDTTFTYCVVAVTAQGDASDWTCDTGYRALAPPTSVLATDDAEEDEVTITWTDASEAEAGYRVYRVAEDEADTAAATLLGATGADKTSFIDFTGVPGISYVYRVVAFDADGESVPKEDTGRRTLLAPTQVDVSDGTSETEILLTWVDNSRVEAGYRLYRQVTGSDTPEVLAETDARVTEYADETAAFGVDYTYTVVAFDAYGESTGASDTGYATILAPQSFHASTSYDDRIELSWVDASVIEEGYYLQRSLDGQTWDSLTTVAANTIGYTDADAALSANTDYFYCITAFSGAATSACDDAQATGLRLVVITPGEAEQQKLVAEDEAFVKNFGQYLAVTDQYAFIASSKSSTSGLGTAALYIFEVNDDFTWTQTANMVFGEEENQPTAVAAYGEQALVGSSLDDRAYMIERDASTGAWGVIAILKPSDGDGTGFGTSVALTYNETLGGTIALVGNPEQHDEGGFIKFYEFASENQWGTNCVTTDGIPTCEETQNISNPGDANFFGQNVALDGVTAVVDETNADKVWVYERIDSEWQQIDAWTGDDDDSDPNNNSTQFDKVAISGDYAFVGAWSEAWDASANLSTGAVYVFQRDNDLNTWARLQKLTVDGSYRFGFSVAADGTGLVVGASGAGAGEAYFYELQENGFWEVQEQLTAFDGTDEDDFGSKVAISGANILVSSPSSTESNATGAAYISVTDLQPISAPGNVAVTDGQFDSRIQVSWEDLSIAELGYRIYRNGEAIEFTSPNVTAYSDFDAAPGLLHTYCVETVSDLFSPSDLVCDEGWRPANGAIGGRVASEGGAGIEAVAVCLTPAPMQALQLDGSGGYARIDDLVFFDETDLSAFTVAFWMQTNATDLDGVPFSYATADEPNTLTIGGAQDLRLWVNGEATSSSGLAVNDGAWHHIAATWESETGTAKLYVDGEEVSSGTLAQGTALPAGGVLVLGQQQLDAEGTLEPTQAFRGQLDDIRLWSVVRTEDERDALRYDLLSGEETHLAGYWPLDQDESFGGQTPNLTGSPSHATLAGGAYASEATAPLQACALSDQDGNFTLTRIQYGDEATFSVTPTLDARQFDPVTKTITLTTQSPVQNEVFFTDVSAFTLAGLVEFPSPFDGTVCPAEDIEMLLGTPGSNDATLQTTTEKDGAYSIAADLGDRELIPSLTNSTESGGDGLVHTFDPASVTLDVQGDVPDLNFLNTTTRRLTGFVGGGCGNDIGPVTLRLYTANGCFEHETTVEGGDFVLDLPPQKYFVQVVDIDPPSTLDKADMLVFFDELGVQEIDLTTQADTLELVYRAPLSVSITGLDAFLPTGSCSAGLDVLAEDGSVRRTIPEVPILYQNATVALSVEVLEDYGDDNVCEVESGTVTLYDEVGATGAVQDLEIVDGYAPFETIVGQPNLAEGLLVDNIDRSYQQSITAVVEVEGRDAVTETAWVLVDGNRPRNSTFTSVTTGAMPLFVLHDPPGDQSYSYLSEGTTSCLNISRTTAVGGDAGLDLDLTLGFKAGSFPVFVENGGGLLIKSRTVAGRDDGSLNTDDDKLCEESGYDNNVCAPLRGPSLEICTTTTQQFVTASDDAGIGRDADVFVGAAFNLLFAITDVLTADAAQCEVSFSETLGMDFGDDPIETTYTYTQGHLLDTVIPQHEALIALSNNEEIELSASETVTMEASLESWQTLLQENEERVATALAQPEENRSFNAGASYQTSTTLDTTEVTKWERTRIYIDSKSAVGKVFTGSGYDQKVLLAFDVRREWVKVESETENDTRTVGYVLKDGDAGDYFTVDIGTDAVYQTPVFGLVSGASSDPWEPGVPYTNTFACLLEGEDCVLAADEDYPFTQARDNPALSVNPPERLGVDPDGQATFTLGLSNLSETLEDRTYVIQAVHAQNPYGATLRANGSPIHEGLAFSVAANQVQNITLTVDRGPTKFSYESLAVTVSPTGGASAENTTAYFHVQYEAVCSDVSFLRPFDPWTVTTSDSLEIILHDFFLYTPDLTVETLQAEYRAVGTATWNPLATLTYVPPDDDSLTDEQREAYPDGVYKNADGDLVLDAAATSYLAQWLPPSDGAYELRAYTDCGSGDKVYSEVVTGVVDTQPPGVFGQPQPSDLALQLGDDISITFDEPIACASVAAEGAAANVALYVLDPASAVTDTLGIEVGCDGQQLIFTPHADTLRKLENQRLQAWVAGGETGIADAYGNTFASDTAWTFSVRRHQFSWSPVHFDVALPVGSSAVLEAELINGTAFQSVFTITEVPDFVAVNVLDGELPAGGSQSIPLTIADDLEIGQYEGTLIATTNQGDAELLVTVDVVCAPPDWPVDPAAYERNMTVIAEVFLEDDSTPAPVGTQVAAYIGTEVRGVGTVEAFDDLGADLLFLNIYDDAEDSDNGDLRFEVWTEGTDAATCRTYTYAETYPDAATTADTPLTFADDALAGTTTVPVRLIAADPQQAIALAAGWTWFSINHDYGTDNDLDNVLGSLVLATGDLVKSHADGFATYDASVPGWAGSLTNIELGKGYQIQLAEANTLVLQAGTPVDPSTVEVSLSAGWNAIGYLPEATLDLGTALANLTPTDGDLIKSQTAFAQYDATFGGWIGSLTRLQAGAGYQLYSANGGTFTYPASAAFEERTDDLALGAPRGDGVGADAPALYVSKEGVLHEEAAEVRAAPSGDVPLKRGPYTDAAWAEENPDAARTMRLRAQDYAHTMTLTGVLLEGGVPVQRGGLLLRAFAGDTLRGQAPLRYVAPLEAYRVFLTAYSPAAHGDTLRLALYDANTGETHPLDQHVAFRADARLGSVREPMRLGTEAATAAAPAEALPETFALHANYPNPFNPRTTIKYDVPAAAKVRLVVYDVLGRVVDILVDGEQKAGFHAVQYDAAHLASGVYFYRLEAGDYRQVHKMTLVK